MAWESWLQHFAYGLKGGPEDRWNYTYIDAVIPERSELFFYRYIAIFYSYNTEIEHVSF